MALAAETPRVLHGGSGTRGPFSLSVGGVPITYASSSHIVVTRYNLPTTPVVLVEGTDYSLSASSVMPAVGQETQTVTAATLTLDASEKILGPDEYLLIERVTPNSQTTVLTTGGGFQSAANEKQYDAILRRIQELANQVNRTLRIHPLDPTGALTLDLAAADREDKIIAFDSTGAITLIDMPEDGQDGATGATGPQGPTGPAGPAGSGSGDVLGPATNTDGTVPLWNGANTKTLKTATAAEGRTALGLGSAALLASSAVFQVANNLSEGTASTMRSNLGLGSAALLASSAVAQTANNLSDLASAATARTNLGLGTAAILAETTTAQYRANTADKVLSTDQVWAAGAEVTLTDAATIAVDMSTFINGIVTLEGNRTLGQPSNTKVGQCGVIRIVQDGTGSRTLAYHADWKFANGSDPVLTTTPGATDLLFYQVIAANFIYASLVKAVA